MDSIKLTFKDKPTHNEAFSFLSLLGRYKTDFVSALVCEYLKDADLTDIKDEKAARIIAQIYISTNKTMQALPKEQAVSKETDFVSKEMAKPAEEVKMSEPVLNENLLGSLGGFY